LEKIEMVDLKKASSEQKLSVEKLCSEIKLEMSELFNKTKILGQFAFFPLSAFLLFIIAFLYVVKYNLF
jgi:hypothetical protein